jgi:uncharacterized membrane protein
MITAEDPGTAIGCPGSAITRPPLSDVTVVATDRPSYSPLERTMPDMREWVELSSQGIQALAVVIIVTSIIFGSLRYVAHLSKRIAHAYSAYKQLLGRSLLLALELLVAADVIRTVLLDLTAKGMEILGALVVVRTFLSWSLVVELEGHWPWQTSALAAQSQPARWAVSVPVPSAAPEVVKVSEANVDTL